jgi:hypothetical protein
VAIDPTTPPHPLDADVPIIDNELPAYRAVTPKAIASLIFGIAAIFSFVNPYFAIFGALAILCGVAARRSIRRFPEVLTGGKMADVGTGLGLLFTLSALTISGVQTWIMNREAGKFAREYVEVLRNGSLPKAIYYQQHSETRKSKTPDEVFQEFKGGMRTPGMFEMETQDTTGLLKRLSGPNQTIALGERLGTLVDGMTPYVEFSLVISGPKTQEFPEETQYALLRLAGTPKGRTYDWRVFHLKFPMPKEKLGL